MVKIGGGESRFFARKRDFRAKASSAPSVVRGCAAIDRLPLSFGAVGVWGEGTPRPLRGGARQTIFGVTGAKADSCLCADLRRVRPDGSEERTCGDHRGRFFFS